MSNEQCSLSPDSQLGRGQEESASAKGCKWCHCLRSVVLWKSELVIQLAILSDVIDISLAGNGLTDRSFLTVTNLGYLSKEQVSTCE